MASVLIARTTQPLCLDDYDPTNLSCQTHDGKLKSACVNMISTVGKRVGQVLANFFWSFTARVCQLKFV